MFFIYKVIHLHCKAIQNTCIRNIDLDVYTDIDTIGSDLWSTPEPVGAWLVMHRGARGIVGGTQEETLGESLVVLLLLLLVCCGHFHLPHGKFFLFYILNNY